MRRCPKCESVYEDSWKVCLHCSEPLEDCELKIDPGSLKKCPYCGEGIQVDAVKCRYCGEFLVRVKKPPITAGSVRFPKIWVGFVLAAIFLAAEVIEIVLRPSSVHERFSPWSVLLGLVGLVYWCRCLYSIHKAVFVMADNCYPISPARAVGFGFLPIYNLYWMFKWPSELLDFVRMRSNIKTCEPWAVGLLLLIGAIAGKIDGTVWLVINFSVLAYLTGLLKRSLKANPEPVPFRSKAKGVSGGATVALVLVCLLPIMGLLAAIAIPNFIRARMVAESHVCINNMKEIQNAKLAWARDTGAANDATPQWKDLIPAYLSKIPVCVKGGSYSIGQVNAYPKCSIGNNNTEYIYDDHILK